MDSILPALISLAQNTALLLATALLIDIFGTKWRTDSNTLQQAAAGVALGMICILVMLTPWTLMPGVAFDTRSILIGVSGLFFGAIPTVITMIMASLLRIFQGGAGMWTGVMVILTSGIIGLAWRSRRKDVLHLISLKELILLGLVIHVVMLGMMLTLPGNISGAVISSMALPVLLIYPLGTALLGTLIVRRLAREKLNQQLQESEEKYKNYIEKAPYGAFIFNDSGQCVDANPEACRMTGYSKQQLLGMSFNDLIPPPASGRNDSRIFAFLKSTGSQDAELTLRTRDGRDINVAMRAASLPGNLYIAFCKDITDKLLSSRYHYLSTSILEILNRSEGFDDSLALILDQIKESTGVDAVGMRLKKGDDYPYYAHHGFAHEFIARENSLLVRDVSGDVCRDSDGTPTLECTCGLVLTGKTDPANPMFTPGGSAWTNDSFPVLELPEEDDPRTNPRNKCIHEGYASVALIPVSIRNHIVGLLQLNSRRKGMFSLEAVQHLEAIASNIGQALLRKQVESEILESEKRFRMLVENSPDAIFVQTDFTFAYLNDAAVRLFGAESADELLGQPVLDRCHPDFREGVRERIKTLNEDKNSVPMIEQVYLRLDQKPVSVEVSAVPVHYSGADGALVFVRDITARKEAQEMICRESAVHQGLAEIARAITLPEASIASLSQEVHKHALRLTSSAYGFVSSIDPESGDNVGHTLSFMMGKELCQVENDRISFPKGADGYSGLHGHALNTLESFYTNKPSEHSSARGLPDGHVPVNRFLSVPAVFNGELFGQIALANAERDYNEADIRVVEALADLFAMAVYRMRSVQDIIEARDAAQAASEAKDEFMANMSHEIRTPLNGIMGMMQLLEMTELAEDQKEYVDLSIKSGHRLTKLLSDILDMSALESGKVEILQEEFVVSRLGHEMVEMFSAVCQDRNITFDYLPCSDAPEVLIGDEARLRQILFNLVGNAVKFSDQGRITLEMGMIQPQDKDRVNMYFCVKDTGMGMDEEAIDELFKPFAQADSSFTRKNQGPGLGLAIVCRLVELMQGSIVVESVPGQGSVFEIVLPFSTKKSDTDLISQGTITSF